MKYQILLMALLSGLSSLAQTVRRVNNTPGISTPYTAIDAAITAAAAGDIILVEGTGLDYVLPANYTLTKRVTILGPGYLLTENAGTQASPLSATISLTGTFILDVGCEGTVISGIILRNAMEVRVSNITLSHNGLLTVNINNTSPASNFWFHANYPGFFNTFGTALLFSTGNAANNTYTNIVVSNNIFNWKVDFGSVKYGLFVNNVINTAPSSLSNLTNFQVINSIFNNLSGLTLTNALVQNNVFCGSGYYPAFAANLNNIINATFSNVCVGATGYTPDTMYTLKAGSVAIGTGINGIDIGIFGGPTPYKLSGIAEGLPTLTNFTSPGVVQQNGVLNVKVSAKSN